MTDTSTTTETTETEQADASATTDTEGTETTDYKAEAEKWQALARKHEDRAKKNATAEKELEELRKQAMTDQERAVAEAKAQGRTETLAEMGSKLVLAEFRAVAAGRLDDDQLTTLLENLNVTGLLTDAGDVDQAKVARVVDGIAPKEADAGTGTATTTQQTRPDLGQGARADSSKALNGDPLLRDLKAIVGAR